VSSNSSFLPGPGDQSESDPRELVVDPAPRPVRRSFTAGYRAQVVAEYEIAPHGSKAAVLRREGLYQSQIREWTRARDAVTRGVARASATASGSHRWQGRSCAVAGGEPAPDPRAGQGGGGGAARRGHRCLSSSRRR